MVSFNCLGWNKVWLMQPLVSGLTTSSIRLLSCINFSLKAHLVTCFAKNNTKSYLFRNTFRPVVSHSVLIRITATSSLYTLHVLEALAAIWSMLQKMVVELRLDLHNGACIRVSVPFRVIKFSCCSLVRNGASSSLASLEQGGTLLIDTVTIIKRAPAVLDILGLTNQPTSQPTNQPTNHPNNQLTYQTNNQPTNNQSTNWPTNHPVYCIYCIYSFYVALRILSSFW